MDHIFSKVPNHEEFSKQKLIDIERKSQDIVLRQKAVELQIMADKYKFTYQFDWLGVPIIRLPDDIVVYQELLFQLKPEIIIETGIARGGSLILSASIMNMLNINGKVLGIDIKIHSHTKNKIDNHYLSSSISMWEGDSSSISCRKVVQDFINNHNKPIVLVLDSDHTEQHVLQELETLTPILPIGSYILVADTLISEFPENYYKDRAWNKYNNPKTAIEKFLKLNKNFVVDKFWSRKALVSEFRDGILIKVN